MNFAAPWFLIAAVLVVLLWLVAVRSKAPLPRWQRVAVTALQSVAVLAAVLALARPWRAAADAAHRVAVVAGAAQQQVSAWREAAPRRQPFAVVAAGAAPVVGEPGRDAVPAVGGTPDVAAALRAAAAGIPAGAGGVIGLYSEGRHDGAALAPLATELSARGVELCVRWLPQPAAADVQLLGLAAPPRVAPGEAFRLEARVRSAVARPGRLEVRAGEVVVASAVVALRPGEQQCSVDCVLAREGVNELHVALDGVDARVGAERTAVLVASPMTVLQLAPEPSRRQALAATLSPQGIEVIAPDPTQPLDAALLQRCSAVLVDDLPADAWPAASQELVRDAVLQRGLGLLLAGTYSNLGPGGYASSPLLGVLPVRMPQREERRDPSVSLVLIIDTSGSMGGGRIELAKEVARLAVQKLQPHDKVGIVEFYGSKRWAAPLQPASNTIEITRALNRLQAGGGTIIYDALEEAYFALLNAHTRFQHILVLTDGGVESGPFEALARRMAASGQTLSTVLIGPQANSPFLLNLAQWGRGRFYSCPDRFQLPELQFREPQSALLPAVQERRIGLERSEPAEAVAAFAGDALAPSGGMVEASVRPEAEVLLRGDGGEPYLIGWDQGAGRVLVLTGQTLGPQSGELRVDPAYGAFLADLLRSAGDGASALAPRLGLAAQERGVRVQLSLPAGTQLPRDPIVRFDGGAAAAMAPAGGSTFTAFLPWPGTAAAALSVQSGELVLARGAAVAPLSRQARAGDARAALTALAAATGGDVGGLDVPLPLTGGRGGDEQVQMLASRFVLVALIAFVLGLLLRRLSFDGRPPQVAKAPLWLLALVLLGGGLRAQAPQGAMDEAAIRAAIDAELRARGDLTALAQQWRGGTPLQHLLLAMAQGDLAAAAELCEQEPLKSQKPELRADLLDILGRPKAALAAMSTVPVGTPVQQGEWRLRRALLLAALGQTEAAQAELRQAVETVQQPQFEDRAGLLAGMIGYFPLALQWHRARADGGRLPFQASLRRGLWQERQAAPRAAMTEYAAAFAAAPLQRDRYYALSQLVGAARAADALPELADQWLARSRGQGEAMTLPELRVLLVVLREQGRARDGLEVLGALDADARHELEDVALDLALAANDPEVALQQLRARIATAPHDAESRSSLAVLLGDLQRDQEAERVLQEGIAGAGPKQLRLLCQTASELGLDAGVEALATAFGARSEPGAGTEAALMRVQHDRRQGRDKQAAALLLAARAGAVRPTDQLRIAEQLESLGKQKEAIELYRRLYAATNTEDLGLRLAWLLSESKQDDDRQQAQAIFRRIWTTAGSAARRVQAEEHVLDLAAREGNLADLAIELDGQLLDQGTPNRPAVRDALVKIYSRARDTVGAVQVLKQWAREEPEHALDALEQEARVYLSAEEFKNHERALQRLLQEDPKNELDYRQQLAMSALERGRPADARRYLQGLLDRPGEPDQVAIEFAAGVYALAGMHDEAVKLYRRALAVHPERVETFLLLGNAQKSAGHRELAIGTFQELLLRPLPDDLFVVAVDGLLNMEAPADALAAAARAVRLRLAARPDQVFLHRVLQDLLEAIGDDKGRLMELQDTVVAGGEQRTNFVRELMQEAETRRDWRTYAHYGRTLLLLGDEVPPAVFLSLGEAMLQLGDLDAATRAFQRARLANDFASVEVRMAELYEQAGRLAEAERIRRHILRRKPDDMEAMLAVARLAERQGARERALPLYLRLCSELLDKELPVAPVRSSGALRPRLLAVGGRNTQAQQVAFAEPFAGVLRCSAQLDDVAPLLVQLRAALAPGEDGAYDRPLAALGMLRQLALAFGDEGLRQEVHSGEDQLLARCDDAKLRASVVTRRLDAGELQLAAAALPATPVDEDARWQRLRLLLLQGDDVALLAAATTEKPDLLPELIRGLLLAGRPQSAMALVRQLDAAVQQDPEAAGAAWVEAHHLCGDPVDESAVQRQRLQQALQKQGTLAQRVSAIVAALRGCPGLSPSERGAQLQQLAAQVLAEKDPTLAERLLTEADGSYPGDVEQQLVELLFSRVDQVYQIGGRTRYLAALPVARGLDLLQGALRKFSAEQQRQQAWRILQSPGKLAPEFLLGVVAMLDFDKLTPADRSMLTMVLTRSQLAPAVATELGARLRKTLPEDASTALLLARLQPDAAARRQQALAALRQLGQKREIETREGSGVDALLAMVTVDDAKALLQELPGGGGPLLMKVALLRATDQKAAAADTLVAAYQRKPEDTALLYQAARFLEGDGMLSRAAELYRTARDRAGTFYPFQAQQLARIELELGDCAGALKSLQAAKDPQLSNFRLYLAVLAGIQDPERRITVLRTVLQQRNGSRRGSGSLVLFRPTRAGGKDDTLAAALQVPQLPSLHIDTALDYDDATSDYDLLGLMPEGEACARDLLRTMDAGERDADLGIYRGLLASARLNGNAEALLATALQQLQQEPFLAEALRVVLAAAEIGMRVPPEPLRAALLRRASERRTDAGALVEMLTVAAQQQDRELQDRVLNVLLASRPGLTDSRMRAFLPGLLALVADRAPLRLLGLAPAVGEPLLSDVDPQLLAAAVMGRVDLTAAAAAWRPAVTKWLDDHDGGGRLTLVQMPWCGLMLAAGDVDGAIAALHALPDYVLINFSPHLLAAAMPPLDCWASPEQLGSVIDSLLAGAGEGQDERRGMFVRIGAVLVARLRAADRAAEAAVLQQRLLAAAGGLPLRVADWFPTR